MVYSEFSEFNLKPEANINISNLLENSYSWAKKYLLEKLKENLKIFQSEKMDKIIENVIINQEVYFDDQDWSED